MRCQAFALTGDARATDPVSISRHATRMSPRWRLCSTTRPTPTGGCEFRRLRRATVLANIDGSVPNCRAYRSAGANPPLSSPLSAGSSEADQSVVQFPGAGYPR